MVCLSNIIPHNTKRQNNEKNPSKQTTWMNNVKKRPEYKYVNNQTWCTNPVDIIKKGPWCKNISTSLIVHIHSYFVVSRWWKDTLYIMIILSLLKYTQISLNKPYLHHNNILHIIIILSTSSFLLFFLLLFFTKFLPSTVLPISFLFQSILIVESGSKNNNLSTTRRIGKPVWSDIVTFAFTTLAC